MDIKKLRNRQGGYQLTVNALGARVLLKQLDAPSNHLTEFQEMARQQMAQALRKELDGLE